MGEVDWFPLLLSLRVAGIATLLTSVVGVAGAYALARFRFPGRGLVEAIASLPIVLPPTVLGYYLLVSIGRNSPIGRGYEAVFGQPLVFTWQAAVVAAAVASLPYCLRTARAAITAIDAGYEEAARVAGLHGARLAFTVTLPLAGRGIVAGISLAFARALGDFGTTIMVAGNIPGRTQTMPIAVYDRVQAFDYATAGMLAAVLSFVAIVVLLAVRRLERSAL
ncbi:MAG: molybdate ABC transporter permease subunit [Nitriliruptor sp.]|nr:MAG: molybdate ABC transporter permease subunit [Nitriliruptor sp.]TVR22406.1 MAG: molybdate ABC transporter permease subunit [Nitriliruptor sp.]